MAFEPENNPLKNVRVPNTENMDLGGKTLHWLLNGNLKDYKPTKKLETLEQRQKRDNRLNF